VGSKRDKPLKNVINARLFNNGLSTSFYIPRPVLILLKLLKNLFSNTTVSKH
jgi:hypothetical protein